jgi:sterol O-acyltransferase
MHSYITVNGYLQSVLQQAQSTMSKLHLLTEAHEGGWEAAINSAKARRAELDARSGLSSDTPMDDSRDQSALSTPGLTQTSADGTVKSYIDAKAASQLRQRLVAVSQEAESNLPGGPRPAAPTRVDSTIPTPPLPTGTIDPGANLDKRTPGAPIIHVLVDHPDEHISAVAREFSELDSELISSGPLYVRYPNNLTWKNFAIYMLIPTLVYELEYPRTDR